MYVFYGKAKPEIDTSDLFMQQFNILSFLSFFIDNQPKTI